MPIYEYHCKKCGKNFELFAKITEKPRKKCIHCGGSAQRQISQTSFTLKGGGWYKDGYSKPSSAPAKAPDNKGKKNEKSATSTTKASA